MMKGHNGIDIPAPRWTPVYAAQSGRVDEVCTEEARGLGVGVRTCAPDGRWYRHRYWHFIALDVESGDEVKTGDLLGMVDSTGYSSGDHLHFELKEVDKDGRVLNQDNGYFGAVDPVPFMEDSYALDIKGVVSTIKLIREKLAILADQIADFLRSKKSGV
jgi:murein DD-endopeptidase MepM/ murein hydrolase activator NlpD